MSGEVYNLDDIVSEYECVLVDTCTLFGYVGGCIEDSLLNKEREILFRENHEFRESLIRHLNQHALIFVTDGVLREYSGGFGYDYKKAVKNAEKLLFLPKRLGYERMNHRSVIEFQRRKRGGIKERRKLIDFFRENDLVLKLGEDQIWVYKNLSNKYDFLKETKGLSDVDYDILISSVVLAKTVGASAVLSNDFGIASARRFLLIKEDLQPEELGFFVRKNNLKFKQLG